MEKEFVSYEQALALKKLGFNEPCFGYYQGGTNNLILEQIINSQGNGNWCLAPTCSQAFAWFEENYGLYCNFVHDFYKDGVNFLWQIFWYLPVEEQVEDLLVTGTMLYGDNGDYETSRNAKIACLEKLIEIANERK